MYTDIHFLSAFICTHTPSPGLSSSGDARSLVEERHVAG